MCTHPQGISGRNSQAYFILLTLDKYFYNILKAGLEITTDHHCGGETFQSISAYSAENTLKSLSSTVMTGRYFDPWKDDLWSPFDIKPRQYYWTSSVGECTL